MKIYITNLFVTLFTLISFHASQASTITIKSRTYFHSCGYYSNTYADFQIQYFNSDLSLNTKVTLVHALSGLNHLGYKSEKVEWFGRTETAMLPLSTQPSSWVLEFGRPVHERSSSFDFSQLVFVFKIIDENNNESWDIGSVKPWSFYQSEINREQVQCLPSYPVPFEYQIRPLQVIERN